MVLRLAATLFYILAMDPFAILALLPGTEAASDQDDVPADSDGGADAVSDHGSQPSVVVSDRVLRQRKNAKRTGLKS